MPAILDLEPGHGDDVSWLHLQNKPGLGVDARDLGAVFTCRTSRAILAWMPAILEPGHGDDVSWLHLQNKPGLGVDACDLGAGR